MLKLYYFLIAPLGMLIMAFAYLKVAAKLNLYDHPVGRSSHINRTITGYGIFVLLGLFLYSVVFPYTLSPYFIIGLVMMATISFIDDIVFVKHFIRLIFQLFALILLAIDLPFDYLTTDKLPLIIAAVIFGIGVLNAFNFMDGINGMLGLNSLVILVSFWWLNNHTYDATGHEITFIANEFIYTLIIGVSIFLFFNLRNKAVAFAGDVGSISIAFVIFYLMVNLCLSSIVCCYRNRCGAYRYFQTPFKRKHICATQRFFIQKTSPCRQIQAC
jgi:UDP-N-acetylmuramyl pentapeptide phosphotransferase/UDP-N-acetylglucosamine-1-phosphate transferase